MHDGGGDAADGSEEGGEETVGFHGTGWIIQPGSQMLESYYLDNGN